MLWKYCYLLLILTSLFQIPVLFDVVGPDWRDVVEIEALAIGEVGPVKVQWGEGKLDALAHKTHILSSLSIKASYSHQYTIYIGTL